VTTAAFICLLILGGITSACAIAFAAFRSWYLERSRVVRTGEMAMATVVRQYTTEVMTAECGGTMHYLELAFPWEGGTHVSTTLVEQDTYERNPVGQTIEVRYLRSQPERLAIPGEHKSDLRTLVFVAAFLVGFVALWWCILGPTVLNAGASAPPE
jgi:hypothetical protein